MQRRDIIIQATLAAGAAILKFDSDVVETKVKSSAGDLVTEADLASEKIITQVLRKAYPNDIIVSEESEETHSMLTEESLHNLTAWVIDPIDGTNNFRRGMGYSGISIGYIENGRPSLGAIFDPYRNELYLAEKGKGATRNKKSVRVSERTHFDAGTRVCTSNSYEAGTQANLDRYGMLGHVWVDVLGSAVLIMADVASGRIDLYHHNGLKPWDNAAAFLIAQEAGAKIVDLHGRPTTWLTAEVVMGNPVLVDEFIARTKV